MVGKLVLALRGASSITLIAAALVLGGALAAGQRYRIYDAVVLKTLGATRAQLLAAYAIEYLSSDLQPSFRRRHGLARCRPGRYPGDGFSVRVCGGAGGRRRAGRAFCHRALGLAGTFTALGRKPAQVLRNL